MTKLGEFGVDTGAFIIADPAFAGEVAKAAPCTGQVNLPIGTTDKTWPAGVQCFLGGDGIFEVFAKGEDEIIIRRK